MDNTADNPDAYHEAGLLGDWENKSLVAYVRYRYDVQDLDGLPEDHTEVDELDVTMCEPWLSTPHGKPDIPLTFAIAAARQSRDPEPDSSWDAAKKMKWLPITTMPLSLFSLRFPNVRRTARQCQHDFRGTKLTAVTSMKGVSEIKDSRHKNLVVRRPLTKLRYTMQLQEEANRECGASLPLDGIRHMEITYELARLRAALNVHKLDVDNKRRWFNDHRFNADEQKIGWLGTQQWSLQLHRALARMRGPPLHDDSSELRQGARVVLQGLNKGSFNNHVAVVLKPPSLLEPRVSVRIAGTTKEIKVRPECCYVATPPRCEDTPESEILRGGQSAGSVMEVLREVSEETFIPEVMDAVLSFLRIRNVDMAHVLACGVSSEAEAHPLSEYTYKAECTLEPGDASCWISKNRSSETEWIVYSMGSEPRRLDYVAMSIPVLPLGPLSVRCFHLESSDSAEGPWTADERHKYETLDVEGLQECAVSPPIEAQFVRLVCTESATDHALGSSFAYAYSVTQQRSIDPIGFWQISFA
eukprot:jgi/Tetstr1/436065/TSEL_024942.t1